MPRLTYAVLALALVVATAQAIYIRPIADVGHLGAVVSDPAPCGVPPHIYPCGKSETIYVVFFRWGTFRLDMSKAYIWTSEPIYNYVGTGKPLCFVGYIEGGVFHAWLITDRLNYCRRLVWIMPKN